MACAEACADFAKAPSSRWSIAVDREGPRLITPCGNKFFSLGVNAVNGGADWRRQGDRVAYSWPSLAPDLESWGRTAAQRLRQWGFNTAGAWSLPPAQLDLPVTPVLELGKLQQYVWIDPFDPALQPRLERAAREAIAPYRGDPRRIGYFSDNELGWWHAPLFLAYMAYPPDNHTKQRLIALLRERYADDWAAFLHDFVPPEGAGSFADLLAGRGSARLRPGGAGIATVRAWTAVVTSQYYRAMREAIHAADPDALLLGDRLPIYYDPDAVRAMIPYVDAVSVNYNVDVADGWIAPFFFRGLHDLTGGKPLLVTEWFFAANENRSGNTNRTGMPHRASAATISNNRNRTGHLMTVGTQAERSAGAAAAAANFLALPDLIGLHWFQYADEPRGGRDDGEDYDFGLVDIDDQPYEGLTEALRAVNLAPPRGGAGPRAGRDLALPYAAIDVGDQSLLDWPKSASLLPLRPAPGEVDFGDVHLAWSERGLFLATIAMDYYDPELLAFSGGFPREEAFRIELGADAGAGPRRFTLHVVPSGVERHDVDTGNSLSFVTEWCRRNGEDCAPVPGGAADYFGTALDQPRVILEAFLPWRALGLDGPPARGALRLDVAVSAFYRARWMSLSGRPPDAAMAAAKLWPNATLTRAAPRFSALSGTSAPAPRRPVPHRAEAPPN